MDDWGAWKLEHTERNPHPVDTAIPPDRIELMLSVKPPDRLDFLANLGSAEFLDRLSGILVPGKSQGRITGNNTYRMTIGLPCGDHDDIGFYFAPIVEKRTRFVEPLELRAALDLDLAIDNHRAGPNV